LSAKQLVNNLFSTFNSTEVDSGDLEDTRRWRLEWWNEIIDYTFDGPYFWTGKGFGVNLAMVDSFMTGNEDPNTPLLRAPHNGHFDILARSGVPGLTLWLATLGAWTTMLMTNMFYARVRGDDAWVDFFVLIFCYALTIVIEASFGLALEGPMLGIWFWSLFGVGIGSSMIYRAQFNGELSGARQTDVKAVRST
jgi:O-antigen ligase